MRYDVGRELHRAFSDIFLRVWYRERGVLRGIAARVVAPREFE